MAAYSFFDRLLHWLALQTTSLAEMSFDLDQNLVATAPEAIRGERHIFVSGLARAGTTALMRRFYASGCFRSLTYRDMPFVLAPNLWRKLARSANGTVATSERAHGDGILVDADSPESLDEVFWRTFAGPEYIEATHLKPHSPDDETTWNYVRYVNAILNAQDRYQPRYLSKNNNNILRLTALRNAFPDALILVPFRDPLTHARSLLRQHGHFSKLQTEDPFVRSYMTWLGHHEFGLDHRPFHFGDPLPADSSVLDYWLALWRATYAWLEHTAPADAVFVCYEDLCTNPDTWAQIAKAADIVPQPQGAVPFRLSAACREGTPDEGLAAQAGALYGRLIERSRRPLT